MSKIKVPSDGILATVEALATVCELLDSKGLIRRDDLSEKLMETGRRFGGLGNADGALVMTYLISRLKMNAAP